MPRLFLRGEMNNALRFPASSRRSSSFFATLSVTLWLCGCGNFWQNPYATGTGSGGGSTASTTTLSASPTSAAVGATVTLTATVSPSAATGSVTFYNGSTTINTVTLSSGTATYATSFTSAGSQSLTASYSGDDTYSSSTSDAVTVTVTAAASSRLAAAGSASTAEAAAGSGAAKAIRVATAAYAAAPIHATQDFHAAGGAFTANNAEGVVVEGKASVALTESRLSAATGKGRGVLLFQSSSHSGDPSFSMTGGSLRYDCDEASLPSCAEETPSKEISRPSTLFAVANAKAAITLTDVKTTNRTASEAHPDGTLLTVAALPAWGKPGRNGGDATLRALGTALTGDVGVDRDSSAQIAILQDTSGSGSTLTGAIDAAGTGKSVSLELDRASVWTVTGTSHLTSLSGLEFDGQAVNNIDGGGHCVYYSGNINGSPGKTVFPLSGGGFLAPVGTTGLRCE